MGKSQECSRRFRRSRGNCERLKIPEGESQGFLHAEVVKAQTRQLSFITRGRQDIALVSIGVQSAPRARDVLLPRHAAGTQNGRFLAATLQRSVLYKMQAGEPSLKKLAYRQPGNSTILPVCGVDAVSSLLSE